MKHLCSYLLGMTLPVLLLCGGIGSALAQSIVATGESFITPRLLPGKVTDGGGRMAGLRLSLEPGWKTYWRSPGETGIPPRFDWSGSQNVQSLRVHWPRPTLFQSFGMRTAGYSDVVVFPLELTPLDASRPMRLELSADLGVCKEICVLEHVTAILEITPSDAEIGERQIRSALRQVPKLAAAPEAHIRTCNISGTGRDRQMVALLGLHEEISNVTVLVENGQGLWIRHVNQTQTDAGLRLEVDFTTPEELSWIDRSAFRMTVLSDVGAYDLQGCTAG